jgi:putative folate metabolism gamma-glutamate ligase
MIVTPIKTKVVSENDTLFSVLNSSIEVLAEDTVLAITSKIVAITEKRTAPLGDKSFKKKLIVKEADLYIDDPLFDKYGIILTIKNNQLTVSAGIDESNANGRYVLWPENPMESARKIWTYLRKKHNVTKLGIVITDSRSAPLRWGVTGYAIGWCGFKPLKRYIGTPDLFGRPFHFVNTSVIDSLAATAVTVMGEGAEQTPLATVTDIPDIEFTTRPPTEKEIRSLKINLEDDLYAPLLRQIVWKKGKGGS